MVYVNLVWLAVQIFPDVWWRLPSQVRGVIILQAVCVAVGVAYVLYRSWVIRKLPSKKYNVAGDPYKVELPSVK